MNCLIRNSKNLPRIIIDSSTLFSAIYNRKGNEAHLLELADLGRCEIILLDYVLEEIDSVFRRKGLDIELVYDLLDNIENITISTLEEITVDEISISRKLINDPLDRPIFIFVIREIATDDDTFFVTGDKGFFRDEVKEELKGRLLHTTEAISLIQN